MALRKKSIGLRLRKQRSLMGYSIREAASKTGLAPIRLSQWERDLRKPSIDNIVKLAVLYRVLVDELVFDLRQDAAHVMDARQDNSGVARVKLNKEKPP
jgi:transcriptional regulator with XRE-family HTH domain